MQSDNHLQKRQRRHIEPNISGAFSDGGVLGNQKGMKINLPKTKEGLAYTITSSYGNGGISIENFINPGHFTKNGVLVIKRVR